MGQGLECLCLELGEWELSEETACSHGKCSGPGAPALLV